MIEPKQSIFHYAPDNKKIIKAYINLKLDYALKKGCTIKYLQSIHLLAFELGSIKVSSFI